MNLLLALYALVALFYSEHPIKEAYTALKNPSLKDFFGKIPSLEATIKAAIRGELDFAALGEDLKVFTAKYAMDQQSKASVRALLLAFSKWMRTSSPSAMRLIEKTSASQSMPHWTAQVFSKDVGSQGPAKKKLQVIVKRLTGEQGRSMLTLDEAKAASANDRELYSQYLALRKEFTVVWKDFLANYIRSSGKKTVPFVDVKAAMAAAGIESNLPTGFTGKIDALGRWYSEFDELLDKNPGANMFPTVKMNPLYKKGSGTFVYQCYRTNGKAAQRGYSVAQKHERADEKFSKVEDFTPKIDAVRRVWLKGVKAFDETKPATVAALILELVFQFSARIGHFSSVKRSGYSTVAAGFQIQYAGKDNVPTLHKYKGMDPLAKQIVVNVAALAAGKSPTDFLFTYTQPNGKKIRIRPSFVNKVFKGCGAVGVTVHKLRTYNGTKLFRHEMNKVFSKREAVTPKEADRMVNDMAMKVGVLLNHIRTKSDGTTSATPATALGSYIDLGAQVEFYQHYGLPLPGRLERFVRDPDAEDATASALTAAYAVVADGEAPKTMTPPPPKVKPADTKMKKVEEPIKPNPVTEKAAEPKTNEEDEDAAKKVIDLTPNPDLDEDPGEDEDELSPEETKDLKLSEKLKKQAGEVMDQMVNDGEVHDAYQDDAGTVDNMLVDQRNFPDRPTRP